MNIQPGDMFGKLKALEFTGRYRYYGKERRPSEIWLMQCECGAQMERSVVLLRSVIYAGGTPACTRCQKRSRTYLYVGVDVTGHIFGKLTALRLVTQNRRHLWEFRCECGNIITKRLSDVMKSVKANHTPSCGRSECRWRLDDEEVVWNTAISVYKASAVERGLPYELSRADAMALFTGNCHYCGAEPSIPIKHKRRAHIQVKRNGIDRIDSGRGYVRGNVVSCCWTCNQAKLNMAYDEFLAWLRRAANHQFNI